MAIEQQTTKNLLNNNNNNNNNETLNSHIFFYCVLNKKFNFTYSKFYLLSR